MYKIYSRRRIYFNKPRGTNINSKTGINIKRKRLRFGRVIIIAIIALLTVNLLLNYINPIYERVGLEYAKALATLITNEQATAVMKKYTYDNMFTIDKDNEGNITMIKSNISEINAIISDIAVLIQKELNNSIRNEINIPLGSFSGISLFSGTGPSVKMKLILLGNIDTELKSEFISKGINQTLHRVYLQIDCDIKVLSAYKNLYSTVSNQVLLIENVIVGNIPSTYYNLEGMETYEDTLNVVQ